MSKKRSRTTGSKWQEVATEQHTLQFKWNS